MKKTKYQLRHKRERMNRRPINKELYKEMTKNFKHSIPKKFPKDDFIEIGDVVIKFRVNKLGQICEIKSNDSYVISCLQNRPYRKIVK